MVPFPPQMLPQFFPLKHASKSKWKFSPSNSILNVFILGAEQYLEWINELFLFLWYGWPKGIYPYFQPRPLSEILTTTNFRHVMSRIWIGTEPEFRLSWMKLCSSDNHYTTLPWMVRQKAWTLISIKVPKYIF